MKALLLNSGLGSRMGDATKEHPKCMTELDQAETILSRQLRLISQVGIRQAVITTGYYNKILEDYCLSLGYALQYEFVHNERYQDTNYIYSIYCAREFLQDDILLMHGDLVFSAEVLQMAMNSKRSCMVVSTTQEIPQKDFKAVIEGDRIQKIGINFFQNAVAAQPLYHFNRQDWEIWLRAIISFCERNDVRCYAENAFNTVSDRCRLIPLDVQEKLCCEIDTLEDLSVVKGKLQNAVN